MAVDDFQVEIDAEAGQQAVEAWQDAMREGGKDAVSQLSVLAESAMKQHAPEGVGIPETHMRTTIQALPETRSVQKTVMPLKRTDEGWLLVRAIVGNPSTPTYTRKRPPVWIDTPGGDAQGPLAQWADAKLGDQNAAWAIANKIQARGSQATFPNPFVRDSYRQWQTQVGQVATDAVEDALGDSP